MSAWVGRDVLVTGGCGFIGSHLVEALLAEGARVRVLDLYNAANSRGFLEGLSHPDLDIRLGDVSDQEFTRDVVAGCDTVFHLAALIGIPYSYVAPGHYVRVNVGGTLAVLEAVRREGVRRLIHTSTSETYGTAQYTPIDEKHPAVAQSPYAATKVAADQLAGSYHRSFDVPVVTIRPFNTFGPRQSMRAVLPTVMAQALYADEVKVGSVEPRRDMTYVSDTVNGFLLAGAAEGLEGEVYNLGTGVAHSVGEMIEMVFEVTGERKPVRTDSERVRPERSEVDELLSDFSRARDAFGFTPQVSFLEGLRRLRDHVAESRPTDPTSYTV
ncbi:NAD-dependent 4,6-dehydratase LegB [Sporichthya brevicatena]|uniref:NAD-dependent 4,6-dehydratase LegB n=1 Tax=Sporichthya brevicatena TaxID=171442 RepID=A0ABP3S9P4_9ACTN